MVKSQRHWPIAVLAGVMASALFACGGSSGSPAEPPPPNPLYVRQSGDDANTGADPATALRTINRAAQLARKGYTIVVGAGTYPGNITTDRPGEVPDGIAFVADVRGQITGDAGPVTVDAGGAGPGFSLSNTGPLRQGGKTLRPTIDGFTVINATDGGVVVKGGLDFIVQNCTVSGTSGSGIRLQGTANSLVFNNLVYRNRTSARIEGVGIALTLGSNGNLLVNNTIALNESHGIRVGNSDQASNGTYIRNNIIQANGGDASLKIFGRDTTYTGGFNLVLPDVYNPTSIRRNQDIHVDAQFVNSLQNNFALQLTSPALGAGIMPKIDTGGGVFVDIRTVDRLRDVLEGEDVTLGEFLADRTVTATNDCDTGTPDLGVHTPPPQRCTAPR
ncbi:right-handed parallel beta-helix repeat-containing protein [Candidatus Binatia bacterium]|nr:right-handed parallel beta-helix repeat-containing protein [Candidatus Binatia bacterium]